MMRFTFTASLIAACAFAQESYDDLCYNEPDHPDCVDATQDPAEECPFLKVFEKNEADQWQVKSLDLPQISFTDVDDQEVMDWIAEKDDIMAGQRQKWEDAWKLFEDAIDQPWEDFMVRAENISDESREIGLQTDEEIVQFVANNTFVDGESLNELFPEIEEFMTQYRTEAQKLDQVLDFNLLFRKTPRNLQLTGWLDAEGIYHLNETIAEEWASEDSTSYESSDDESSDDESEAMEAAMEKIESAFVSYGYDPDVVQTWLQDQSASWQDIQQAQDEEAAAMAKADIAEAADYVNNILNNMVTDLRQRQMDDQQAFEEALDSRVADLKSRVEAQAQENIDKLSDWIDNAHNKIMDATTEEEETMPVDDTAVAFAIKKSKKAKKAKSAAASSSSYLGYGAIALSAAATAAYIFQKRSESKMIQSDEELDEGFSQI